MLTFFSRCNSLMSARSSVLIFLTLKKTTKIFVMHYGYRHSRDDATLFSKADSNKLRLNVKNETALICAKFGADLTNTSKVRSRKTKWPFSGLPCIS